MSILDILQIAGIIVVAVAALAGIIGYLGITYKKASRERMDNVVNSSDQLSNFWKEQADGYKEMMSEKESKWQESSAKKDAETQKQINTLTREIGEIRGQLNEKTKQAEDYKLIFQGQNPEMKQFMETMLAVAKQSQNFMDEDRKYKEDQHKVMMAILGYLNSSVPSPAVVAEGVKFEGTIKKN